MILIFLHIQSTFSKECKMYVFIVKFSMGSYPRVPRTCSTHMYTKEETIKLSLYHLKNYHFH